MGMVIFEESGTFNPATFGLQVGDVLNIVCVGGGGGGGGGGWNSSTSSGGAWSGGGGAGGDVRFGTHKLASLTSISVTVGAGGSGGKGTSGTSTDESAGSAGGTSSFGTAVSATGGPGGALGVDSTWQMETAPARNSNGMSVGGAPKYADYNNDGYAIPGGGGGYFPGYPGFGGDADAADPMLASPNSTGRGYGAGGPGGGPGYKRSVNGGAGGDGTPGVVVVTW